jgi:hypothetical protein
MMQFGFSQYKRAVREKIARLLQLRSYFRGIASGELLRRGDAADGKLLTYLSGKLLERVRIH